MNIDSITHCREKDIPTILLMYEQATAYMKSKNMVHWPKFPEPLIKQEIAENRLWCNLIDQEIACIWTSTFSDPVIWRDKNEDPSIYIHKIATKSKFKGRNLVKNIVEWAKLYAIEHKKQFIRMDTVGNNLALINYYQNQGFIFLGTEKLQTTEGLPDHYKNGDVCYFEIDLNKNHEL